MTESRFERWSRKKTEARQDAELPPAAADESQPSHEEQELAVNESLSERELLAKYDLPDPDAIELGTDITGFMRKEIPEFLRRRALRSLWRSNPVLAVLDGLNDYDEDYTNAAAVTSGFKTLYKVGQGYFDKSARRDKPADEPASVLHDQPSDVSESADQVSRLGPTEPLPKKPEPKSEPEPAMVQLIDPQPYDSEDASENEAQSTLRYRPRMRFD
ncbi:DUF3306 domain-containing protein [Marinobacter sp. chi1]|uniref:DUF3306 domain-containing protein n=1 Tax=Marinobacter suaedae TaxID=3057675 RepID=A0ABT8W051_9GAMM|nr:DUF3306 domain-containing protein [Marinobacter sp. chi1]MDO3721632.1 DUF3306 domain-containing protein [Marinobacter sp. chi1]